MAIYKIEKGAVKHKDQLRKTHKTVKLSNKDNPFWMDVSLKRRNVAYGYETRLWCSGRASSCEYTQPQVQGGFLDGFQR